MAFPKKKDEAVRASLRREVVAIEDRSREALLIAVKIAQAHKLFARWPGRVRLQRFRRKKIVRHGPGPSCDHRRERVVLKREADHAIEYRGGEQLLNGSPERTDVHGAVQTEQRLFQFRIDYRVVFFSSRAISLHPPPFLRYAPHSVSVSVRTRVRVY